jgi:hypothetical protein
METFVLNLYRSAPGTLSSRQNCPSKHAVIKQCDEFCTECLANCTHATFLPFIRRKKSLCCLPLHAMASFSWGLRFSSHCFIVHSYESILFHAVPCDPTLMERSRLHPNDRAKPTFLFFAGIGLCFVVHPRRSPIFIE